jgi:electron transfer flavoprotein alpha subunit
MPVLVIAEHDNAVLKDATHKTVTAAARLDPDIHVLVAGSNCGPVATAAARIAGVSKVLCADQPQYAHGLAEPLASLILALAPGYDAILAPSTASGRNVLPRVAALLDVAQISDVIEILSKDTFVRPIYAGNALTTVKSSDAQKLMTVRTIAFTAAAEGGAAVIEPVEGASAPQLSEFLREEVRKTARPELTSAKIIISGGRGMQSGENFQLLERVADRLGAAIGASRAAVDAGFVSNEYQVGQTGKVVAPDLYVAVGISGAIQHLAGMKESKVIVAINKDPDAPIFQLADYGLVADLFQALPEFAAALEELKP